MGRAEGGGDEDGDGTTRGAESLPPEESVTVASTELRRGERREGWGKSSSLPFCWAVWFQCTTLDERDGDVAARSPPTTRNHHRLNSKLESNSSLRHPPLHRLVHSHLSALFPLHDVLSLLPTSLLRTPLRHPPGPPPQALRPHARVNSGGQVRPANPTSSRSQSLSDGRHHESPAVARRGGGARSVETV